MAKKPRKRFETGEGNLDMIKNSVRAIKHHADELTSELKKNPEIEAWVLAKVDRAAQNLSDVTHYLDGEMNKFSYGGMVTTVTKNEIIEKLHQKGYSDEQIEEDFDDLAYDNGFIYDGDENSWTLRRNITTFSKYEIEEMLSKAGYSDEQIEDNLFGLAYDNGYNYDSEYEMWYKEYAKGGMMAKGGKTPIVRTQFEEEEFEYAKGGKVDYGSLYKKIVEAVERKLKISDEEATNLVDENEAFIIDMIEHEEIKNPNQIADAIISDYGEANEEMAKGGRVKRKRWIQDALSGNKGELRKTAKRKGLIKGDEKLSKSDLHKLEKMGGKTSRRAHLAETLIDFKK